ncbi:MAG: M28 family peptidase [Gemmatimonadaceae bacterium]
MPISMLRGAAVVILTGTYPWAALAAQPDAPDIFLAPLRVANGVVAVGAPVNVTGRAGYDNQPSFTPDGAAILYTSQRDGQTDIYRYDLRTKRTTQVTDTPESEYSATITPDGRTFTVVRVESDSTQRLWRFPVVGSAAPQPLLPDVKPVGYYAWADNRTLALFVLGANDMPNTLQVARLGAGRTDTVMSGIGRSLHRVPGGSEVSFLHATATPRAINALDPATQALRRLTSPLEGSEDFAWVSPRLLLMARDTRLYQHSAAPDDLDWRQVADLADDGLAGITRLAVSPRGDWLAFAAVPRPPAGAAPPGAVAAPDSATVREADVRRQLGVLAADSLEGRRTGEPGAERAARFIAAEMTAMGLRPMGDSGSFLQRVPLGMAPGRNGRPRVALLDSWAAQDTVAAADRRTGYNVIGVIPGSDPQLRGEVVLVDAHYDHLGLGAPVDGDSIFNGADDDASGVVAVLQIARALASGPPPKRTVVFSAMTGEEVGLVGTRWYIAHPPFPLERTVANLEIEMIGRPDSLAGGSGKAWLTGYERSTMGDQLKARDIPIVPDPRPDQRFFERSDNIAFARRGIPAHTLSTFNLHDDYHTPDDEVERVDFGHMTSVIEAAVRATRILTDGPKPQWHEGMKP